MTPAGLTLWRRWGAALLPAAGLGAALAATLPGALAGQPLAILLAVLASASLGPLALLEWRRARLARPATAAGLVTVEERRIGVWGPLGGGFIDLADLERIELATGPGAGGGDAVWRLVGGGQALDVPLAAAGAGALIDAFAPLAGFDWAAVDALLAAPGPACRTVWRAPGGDGPPCHAPRRTVISLSQTRTEEGMGNVDTAGGRRPDRAPLAAGRLSGRGVQAARGLADRDRA